MRSPAKSARVALVALSAAVAVVAGAVPATADPAGDVTIAEAGTIQAGDLPVDYAQTAPATSREGMAPDESDSDMTRIARKIPVCKGFVATFGGTPKGVTASADGATFETDTTQATSSVLVFATPAQADALYAPLSAPSLAKCLDRALAKSTEQSLADSAGSGVVFQKATTKVTRTTVDPVGDATAGYRIAISMKASQKASGGPQRTITLDLYADMQFTRVDRAIAMYSFLGMGSPVEGVQAPAVASATARLARAFGG